MEKNKSRQKTPSFTPEQIDRIHENASELADNLEPIVKWEVPPKSAPLITKIIYYICFIGHLVAVLIDELIKWNAVSITINYTFADLFKEAFELLEIDFEITEFGIPWLDGFLNTIISTLPVFDIPPHQQLFRVFLYAVGGFALIQALYYIIKYFSPFISKFLYVVKVVKNLFSFVCLTIALASAIIYSFDCFESTASYYINTIISFMILVFIVFQVRPKKAIDALAYTSASASIAGTEFRTRLRYDNTSTTAKTCHNSVSSSYHADGVKLFRKSLLKFIWLYSLVFSIITIAFALIASWSGWDIVKAVACALTLPSAIVKIAGRVAPMLEKYLSDTYKEIKKHQNK